MSYGYGFRTDNPLADHARWVMEQERLADKLPKCDICGRPIDDHYYNLYGEKCCEGCLDENFRVAVEI